MSPIRPAAVPAILTLFSLGRSTMQRTFAVIAALLALVAAPPVLAQCGSATGVVTTSGYTAGSTSEDVDISCACAEFDSGNPDKLLMGCNGMDGDSQDIGLNSTGAELDYYVVCKEQTDGTWAIAWKVPANWDGAIESWGVGTNSTGSDYQVSAKCRPTGSSSAYDATTLMLGDGMKNNLGALARNF